MNLNAATGAALTLILGAVLFAPVLLRPIEQNLEIFFLVAGTLAAWLSGQLRPATVRAALIEPIGLTAAVLVFGIAARILAPALDRAITRLAQRISPRWLYFALIVVLGLISSVITAVVAALLLAEAIALLRLDRRSEIAAVVLACFAIGLGAALTPIGEPLSTIAIAALRVDFLYLIRLLGPLVLAGILIVGGFSLMLPAHHGQSLRAEREEQALSAVAIRAAKVYIFVAGLVGLSWGLRPLLEAYISGLPHAALFWLNSISAVVDNATLTAVEMGPALSGNQQRSALMGLLISGGMLIPGNIPNVIAAGRLGITSREWARVGLATGLPLMAACFVVLYLTG